MIDDSDDESYDGSKENIKEPTAVESKKKQKTIENFAVSTSSNVKKEQETEIEKKQFVIDDDEELHDGSESDNRLYIYLFVYLFKLFICLFILPFIWFVYLFVYLILFICLFI